MRNTLVKVMAASSGAFVLLYRTMTTNEEYSLFITLILAGFVVTTILVYALDAIMTSWIRAWFGSIDFFLDEYFKEVERREKERGKNEPQNKEGYNRSDRG